VVEHGITASLSLVTPNESAMISPTNVTRSSLLSEAARIGNELCTSAYWHAGRCNWVGRSAREAPENGLPFTPIAAALGPELYGGTAGVALFLAELFARCPADRLRQTALGAIRQALWKGADLPPPVLRGFFGGAMGIAFAAARVGLLLDEPDLVQEGLALAHRAATASAAEQLLDVIAGNAGSIAPLFWLAGLSGGGELRAFPSALAEELAAAAITDAGVWRWDNQRACGAAVGAVPLCGLAHGASGMGLALIESGVMCERQDWIEGGLAAFRYEDQLFDAARGNWPDLRERAARPGEAAGPAPASFMAAWCHGAPGIGLARLRALRLLPTRRSELEVGVRRAVQATLTLLKALPEGVDATPCHGRGGLAETLLYATQVLGDRQYAAFVAKRWSKSVRDRPEQASWPCGVASGRNNPSLMLGLAGVGYSLLRASAPRRTPSFLVIDASTLPSRVLVGRATAHS
jgi:lantibiotic modifying enzyme